MAFRHQVKPRRIARDFHRPRGGNPLFPRAGQRRGNGPSFGAAMGSRFFLTLLGIGAAGLLWYVVWGSAFHIEKIEVSGVSAPAEEAIRAGITRHMDGELLWILPRANVLFFDEDKALEDVGSRVSLEQVSIRKKFPNSVVITANEKVARAAFDSDGRLFALDETGTVIRELSANEVEMLGVLPPGMDAVATQGLGAQTVDLGSTKPDAKKDAPAKKDATVPLVRATVDATTPGAPKPAETVPGLTAIPTAAMRIILQAHVRLPDIVGEPVRWFTVEPSSETVDAMTVSGWHVLMSSALPFDVQGERLGIVLKDKIGANRASLQYIDLRYNERIFFRMKDGTGQ